MSCKPASLSVTDCTQVAPNKHGYPAISPSSNPCVVKLAGRRKMFNPYRGLTPKKALAQHVAAFAAANAAAAAAAAAQYMPPTVAAAAPLVAFPPSCFTADQRSCGLAVCPPVQAPSPGSSEGSSFTNLMTEVEAELPPRAVHAESDRLSLSFGHMDESGASLSVPASVRFVVVEFKHELCTFQAHFRVSEGDFVVVEADRGEHVGRVKLVLDGAPTFHVPSRILRRAVASEVSVLEAFRPREESAAAQIQRMADRLGLPLRIVDTEFYADGNKMTVFFSSKATVDFRQLQRSLFREFHCRIWLINFAEVQYRNRNFRNRK